MAQEALVKLLFPARDFQASIKAWSTVFGVGPAFSSSGIQRAPGQADFAVFKAADIEIGLTSLPWVDEPLVMLDTDDIAEGRRALIASGAVGLGEISGGSLAPLGTAPVTNGDPESGVVDVPGARMAVVQLADGSKLGLRQSLPTAW